MLHDLTPKLYEYPSRLKLHGYLHHSAHLVWIVSPRMLVNPSSSVVGSILMNDYPWCFNRLISPIHEHRLILLVSLTILRTP